MHVHAGISARCDELSSWRSRFRGSGLPVASEALPARCQHMGRGLTEGLSRARMPSSTLIPFLEGLGSLIDPFKQKRGTLFKPRLLGSLEG